MVFISNKISTFWLGGCLGLVIGCGEKDYDGQPPTTPPGPLAPGAVATTQGDPNMSMNLRSEVFEHGQSIPRRFTGDGQDVSPPLSWSNPPAGTQELALIVDDPDAPTPEPWVHWVIYKIAPQATSLPEGVSPSERVPTPAGVLQGKNSWNKIGYGGPQPPKGHGLHHYHFRLYALDTTLNLQPGASKQEVLKAMDGHILGETVLTGTYQR